MIILFVGLAVSAFFIFMSFRLDRVSRYRLDLIDKIRDAYIADIDNGVFEKARRWDAFNEATFDEMVYKFWRPLNSFYKNDTFLKPSKRQNYIP